MSVVLSPLAGAGAQFFDNNGVPLAGGLLYTYAAGTTTATATYTTSTGNIANSNPIVLDSSGRVPYEIWLSSGTTYKFVLQTANSTQIGSYDNIPGINNVFDSSTISYVPSTSYAVTTTVQSKLQQYLSVFDFMTSAQITAVQSGNTSVDLTIPVQTALIEACALGGKTVFFPAGIYSISSTIYCGPNVTIIGEGTWDGASGYSTIRGTVFTSQTSGIYFFSVLAQSELPSPISSVGLNWPSNANSSSAHSFTMYNCSIYGNLTSQRGIVVGNTIPVTQIYIENCSVRDCLIGIELNSCYGIFINGVEVRASAVSGSPLANSKGFQIGTPGSMTSGCISNCFVYGTYNGIFLNGPDYYPGFSVSNIDIDACTVGIQIGSGTGNIDATSLFYNIGFEGSIQNDVNINVGSGNIGFNGYLQASGSGTTGSCIVANSTSSLNLYLSNGRIALVPITSGVASIALNSNVNLYLHNWSTAGSIPYSYTSINQIFNSTYQQTGSWTPVLTAAGGGSFTGTQTGTYTKIGNLVYISLNISLSANSGTGNLSIAGLPFTANANDNAQAFTANYGRISLTSGYNTLGGQVGASTNSITLFQVGSGSTTSTVSVTASELQSTAYIVMSGVYQATS
jgi:hypothetical protein